MQIRRVYRGEAQQARGIVVVIDVIRAFTVAGYAFAGGASRLWLVRTTEEALALRAREPDALIGGEIGGRLIPGFDFNNSPALMATRSVHGRLLIQRTGAGTQGAVAASQARLVLLCALTNASATTTYARHEAAATGEDIVLHPTASIKDSGDRNEDDICADYVEALLREQTDAGEILSRGIAHMHATDRFEGWRGPSSDFPPEDIPAVLDVNRFHFAMVGIRREWQGITYVEAQRVEVSLRSASLS